MGGSYKAKYFFPVVQYALLVICKYKYKFMLCNSCFFSSSCFSTLLLGERSGSSLHFHLKLFQFFQYVMPDYEYCLPIKCFCIKCEEVTPEPSRYMLVEAHTAPTHPRGCCSLAVSNLCSHIQQPSVSLLF